MQASPALAISRSSTQQFRPIRYEVKAELDGLFGQTKGQKRELALRSMGEDGRLWYDQIEEEEFATLLPACPTTPLTDGSRRSSSATFAHRSPLDFRFRDQDVCSSHSSLALPRSPYTPQHDAAMPNYFAHAGERLVAHEEAPQRRRKRSASELQRANEVDGRYLMPSTVEKEGEEQDLSCSRDSQIYMPAYLPINRKPMDTDELDRAFGVDQRTNSETRVRSPPSFSKRLDEQGRKRPFDLWVPFPEHKEISSPSASACQTRPRSLILSPSTSSHGFPSHQSDQDQQKGNRPRRRSSLDLRYLSLGNTSTPHTDGRSGNARHSPSSSKASQVDSASKVAVVLGMHAGNRHLLCPGGLATGEHVYDGIDIPCRSVYLPSDDEDDCDEMGGMASDRRTRTASSVKAWLKSKRINRA